MVKALYLMEFASHPSLPIMTPAKRLLLVRNFPLCVRCSCSATSTRREASPVRTSTRRVGKRAFGRRAPGGRGVSPRSPEGSVTAESHESSAPEMPMASAGFSSGSGSQQVQPGV